MSAMPASLAGLPGFSLLRSRLVTFMTSSAAGLFRPSLFARRSRSPMSPTTMGLHCALTRESWSAFSASSAPTPAGSPIVIAIFGFIIFFFTVLSDFIQAAQKVQDARPRLNRGARNEAYFFVYAALTKKYEIG